MTQSSGQRLRPLDSLREVRTALIVAPHYDDEVLGCGGLLGHLLSGDVEVEVCFVTDGAGGGERPPERHDAPDYANRRQRESALVAQEFGWHHTTHLRFEDGHLAAASGELRSSLQERLLERRPDLVLLPSAAERTEDHRTVHREGLAALQQWLRDQGDLEGRVLLYEVNQPLTPDLLYDVTPTFHRVETAMALYASQQERHAYLEAARGLRRYRALELPPEVELAEGYVEMTFARCRALPKEDLRAHAPFGVRPGTPASATAQYPKFSVIVRTRDRPLLLRTALASLANSTLRPDRVIVVNDGGAPPDLQGLDSSLNVISLNFEASQGRAGAANAGLDAVETELVAFLDDDDVVAPQHYEILQRALAATDARVVYSDAAVVQMERASSSHWIEVERALPYARDFDPDLLLVDNYIPFHTLLLPSDLVRRVGALDADLEVFEDWDLLIRLSRETAFQHVAEVSCEYRHYRHSAHHALALPGVDRQRWFLEARAKVLSKHRRSLTSDRLARTISQLRREIVEGLGRQSHLRSEASSERAQLRKAWERSRREATLQTERAVRAETESLLHVRELQRLRDVESAASLELGRLGAVQQQLGGRIEELRSQVENLRHEKTAVEAELASFRAQLAQRDDQLRAQYHEAEAQIDRQREAAAALDRAYTDVHRLQRQIETMEATKAWRVHRRIESLRGRSTSTATTVERSPDGESEP